MLFELRMMGDAVMALPFIRSIRESYDVHVCCAPGAFGVFEMVLPREKILCWRPPWIDEAKKYDPVKLLKQYPGDLLRRIKALDIEIGVSAWADPRTSLFMIMSGIPRRIGFDLQTRNYYGSERPWRADGLKKAQILQRVMEAFGKPLLTENLRRNDYLQHHVEDFAQLCRHLGVEWRPHYPWLERAPALLPMEIQSFIKEHQVAGRPVGIIHGGARTEAKRWPSERFGKLLQRYLIPQNLPVILMDLEDCHPPPIRHPLVKLYRPDSVEAYVALAGLADYSVCNDTGSAHLGGATGRPVVTIFSNSRPDWFVPYANEKFAVAGAYCPHMPCLERCVMPSFICRDGVPVEDVANKLSLCLNLIK